MDNLLSPPGDADRYPIGASHVRHMFNTRSIEFLKSVEDSLLKNAGSPGFVCDDCHAISSVDIAVKSITSDRFDAARSRATAELTSASSLNFRQSRSQGRTILDWNDYVANISDVDFDFKNRVENAANSSEPKLGSAECVYVITALIYQTFLAICTDTLESSRLYSLAVPILESGHVPCDWEGVYPDGRIAVY
ncbi:hypothetical protein [Rhodopirellula baltica]